MFTLTPLPTLGCLFSLLHPNDFFLQIWWVCPSARPFLWPADRCLCADCVPRKPSPGGGGKTPAQGGDLSFPVPAHKYCARAICASGCEALRVWRLHPIASQLLPIARCSALARSRFLSMCGYILLPPPSSAVARSHLRRSRRPPAGERGGGVIVVRKEFP